MLNDILLVRKFSIFDLPLCLNLILNDPASIFGTRLSTSIEVQTLSHSAIFAWFVYAKGVSPVF